MSSSLKRKQCHSCGDTFASTQVFKRHRVFCEPESQSDEHRVSEQDTTPEPGPSHVTDQDQSSSCDESDEDEEVYIDENGIEDLLQSFQPGSTQPREAETATKPFFKIMILWTCLFLCIWQSVFYVSTNAITILLQYFHGLLTVAAEHYKVLSFAVPLFPSSAYMLHKLLKINKNNFVHYVVCPTCFNIYTYADCVTTVEGQEISQTCSHVQQPNHPMRHHRRPCGAQLLKTVLLPSGKKKLVPNKSYFYKPLKESIAGLTSRSGFEDKCEHWRQRKPDENSLFDVYDGQIWKSFSDSFLSKKHNYGLMLNLDWFQPFKHVKYSVGVMYMVVLNLPREERFRRENIILVGVIPHMKKEPPTNTFVQPLVDELLHAWSTGFTFTKNKTTRLALMCVGCDIPACRKLCGFLGHAAIQGCSRCKKTFPGDFGKRDYSGFDRHNWRPRTHAEHISEIRNITKCTTKTEREKLETRYGTRYSVLSELPYFDIIRMSIIDPMHNLFLGTAKHMLHVWKDVGVLTDKDFDTIQERCDTVECPSDIGRIPRKIASGFAGFSADQFKNWTLLFSIYCLKDVIADKHLECWRHFVLACRYMCCRVVTQNDIKMADKLLIRFCMTFEKLYGKERVTPNMHLHGHLLDCILDFGPVYSFWLFSFERCNGMMGDICTNKKNVELQLIRRFTCHSHLLGLVHTDQFTFAETLQPVLNQLVSGVEAGSLRTMNTTDCIQLRRLSSRLCQVQDQDWSDIDMYRYSQYKVRTLTNTEESNLTEMYKTLYNSSIEVMPVYQDIKTLYLGTSVFGSLKNVSAKSSNVLAYWTDGSGFINWSVTPRPGKIVRFLRHSIMLSTGVEKHHMLAEVQWHQELPESIKNYCGPPVEAWHPSIFVEKGPSTYMPVQRVKGKFVKIQGHVGQKRVMFVSPRDRFVIV